MTVTPVVVVHWDEAQPMAMALQDIDAEHLSWREQIVRLAQVVPHEATWEVVLWHGHFGTQTLHAVVERWKDRWLM